LTVFHVPPTVLSAASLVAAALGLSRTVIVVCGSVTVLVIVDGGSVSVDTADMIADSRD
jgi:hypothetical protein